MKKLTTIGAIALSLSTLSFPTLAQTTACSNEVSIREGGVTFISNLNQAMNLARQAAEEANGGLENYRAEASMYGSPDQSPCIDNGNNTLTFTFLGSSPGSAIPTVESVVTVAKNGSRVTIDYNGSPRSTTVTRPPVSPDNGNLVLEPDRDPALAKAQNLARQAAERTNGGLGNYRAEASMYGSPSQSPYRDNGDGTVTFTFTGSRPGSTIPIVETQVTVDKSTSRVVVDYNGSLRSGL